MQQTRQQMRDQLGVLEEKLEELGALALRNERQSLDPAPALTYGSDLLLEDALEAVRELGILVQEQQLSKSVSAHDFLQRINSLLVQDASAQGSDIAIAHFGEGKISMEMAELVMGAILSGFRASLKSHQALTRADRVRHHLFPTASMYLEIRASAGEILFRLTDDGQGFSGEGTSQGTERHFQKLREHVARCGGWFRHAVFEGGGGAIEFKVPLSQHRLEALVLRQDKFEILFPSASVAEVVNAGKGEGPAPGAEVFSLHEERGLIAGSAAAACLLRVVVADLQFWLSCDSVGKRVRARRFPAVGFVAEGTWLENFGLFREGEESRALPLIEGAALVNLYKSLGGAP